MNKSMNYDFTNRPYCVETGFFKKEKNNKIK